MLGLPDTADGESIRKAYLRRAMECHPDRKGGQASTETFQRVSLAYQTLSKQNDAEDAFGAEGAFGAFDAEDTSPESYKVLFEQMYRRYAPTIRRCFDSPEMKLARGVYGCLRSTIASKVSQAGEGERPNERVEVDPPPEPEAPEAPEALKHDSQLDITQRIRVTLKEVFDREIKKVVVKRFRWDAAAQRQAPSLHTVVVPLEHVEVCFPGEGDTTANAYGDLHMSVHATDSHLHRDEEDASLLHCAVRISPYDMCYGGGKYLVPHFGRRIVLEVGSQFYRRCHRRVEVPHYGLWNSERGAHGSLMIDVAVDADADTSEPARKALFRSLYACADVEGADGGPTTRVVA